MKTVLLTVRNVLVVAALGALVAAAAFALGGFLAVVGTVQVYLWAGVDGVIIYWSLVVVAILGVIYKLSR